MEIKSFRNDVVESVHRVNYVVTREGKIIKSSGDYNELVSMRSTVKPILLKFLIPNKNGFSDKELSVMMSSHNAEPQHREVIKKIMQANNISIKDINCGTHIPYYPDVCKQFFTETDPSEKQLYNNCSGKHAAALIWCKNNEVHKKGYWQATHPAQIHILESLQKEIGPDRQLKTGIDGCGFLCFHTSLLTIADLYHKIATEDDYEHIRDAMINEPFYLGGSERVETEISTECRLIIKCGAEGVFGAAIPGANTAIALKVESGNEDAADVALVKILMELGVQNLEKWRTTNITNCLGETVGVTQ